MVHEIPDDGLRDVREGYALLTAQELAAPHSRDSSRGAYRPDDSRRHYSENTQGHGRDGQSRESREPAEREAVQDAHMRGLCHFHRLKSLPDCSLPMPHMTRRRLMQSKETS